MITIADMWDKYLKGEISQIDYEISWINEMVRRQRETIPDTEDNFEILMERIILKLADSEILTEHEWESVQRLYFIHSGTILLEDIQETLGYKSVEVIK